MKALSIRQPWAWLILNAGKDIENRDWLTRFRGPFLIHASKGMTRAEYEDAKRTLRACRRSSIELPPFEHLERGGIVGQATLVDCVTDSASPWFFGRFGFVLREAASIEFRAARGSLGFFEVPI
jgi:hypothetical protein